MAPNCCRRRLRRGRGGGGETPTLAPLGGEKTPRPLQTQLIVAACDNLLRALRSPAAAKLLQVGPVYGSEEFAPLERRPLLFAPLSLSARTQLLAMFDWRRWPAVCTNAILDMQIRLPVPPPPPRAQLRPAPAPAIHKEAAGRTMASAAAAVTAARVGGGSLRATTSWPVGGSLT